MPKVVVYGDYPPFRTPAADATLATVRRLLDDGRDVEVVSPRPSAAHHHADIGSPGGAARLAGLVGGAELVARFNPGILGDTRRPGPVAARAAVAVAIRRARTASIHLSPLTAPPAPRWVKAILAPAADVVVASAEDADRLRAAGLRGAALSVSGEPWWHPVSGGGTARSGVAGDAVAGDARAETGRLAAGASREDVEAEVRRRAAVRRDGEAANLVSASWPLHMLHPLAPMPAGAPNALLRLVKRAVHRLVAFEVVPIVEQVNHLQRATIESLDRHAEAVGAQRPPPDTNS